jgi:PleD family two-component response regulator
MATMKKAQTGKNVPKGMVESEMFPGKMIPKSKSNYENSNYDKMLGAKKAPAAKPKAKVVVKPKTSIIQSLEGKKILLVEDNEHNQILAKTYIERRNGIVEIAGNGKIALEMLSAANPYDLILMDIQMPTIDGIEACKIMRSKGII